jgi:hypothetical protein
MKVLFDKEKIEFQVKNKELFLEELCKFTQKRELIRITYQSIHLFEGVIDRDKFDLNYIGDEPRAFGVKMVGEWKVEPDRHQLQIKFSNRISRRILIILWIFISSTISFGLLLLTLKVSAFLLLFLVAFIAYNIFTLRRISLEFFNERGKVINFIFTLAQRANHF